MSSFQEGIDRPLARTSAPAALGARTAARLESLRAAADVAGYGALVVYADGAKESAGHVRYLAGWMPQVSEAVMVIPGEGDAVLVSADKNRARAFAQLAATEIRVVKTRDLMASVATEVGRLVPRGTRVGIVGFDDATTAVRAQLAEVLREQVTAAADALIAGERSRRGEYEAEKHRAAVRVSDAMVQHAMRIGATPGITGADVMVEVERLGRGLGAQSATCWVATGRQPAETYFELFEFTAPIQPGDRLQLGTTVLHDGYFSQVLRIGVLGEPSRELQDMAAELIALQDAALATMVPGRPIHHIGDVLEAGIDRLCPWARSDDPFRFQSCHAMGNSYSEPWSAPFLNADRDRANDTGSPLISAGQTYEIHPNFTSANLGHVCAGDVALVTEDGGVWISEIPRGILRLG